jgi:hypothetical protein
MNIEIKSGKPLKRCPNCGGGSLVRASSLVQIWVRDVLQAGDEAEPHREPWRVPAGMKWCIDCEHGFIKNGGITVSGGMVRYV